MGIFGRVPAGGGPGPSRRDRRQAGVRARTKTVARRETEHRAHMMVMAGMVLVALVILGVGAFGYYQTSIAPKHETVLKVGDRSFSMGQVEKRLRYEINRASAGQLILTNAQFAVYQTLTNLENEEVNRIGAAQKNISVSEDEIDAKIRAQLGVAESADPASYADAYRNAVRDSGLSPNEYRELAASELLEEKIRLALRSVIPATADQVKLLDIQVASQEEAQAVVDRLAAGEDFAAIAAELSLDTSTKNQGGEMGWMPKDALEPEAGDAVFALEVGQWTQPVASTGTGSYFIYKVVEKAAAMELTPEQQDTIEERSYADWQTEISSQVPMARPYITDTEMWNHLIEVAIDEGAAAGQ